MQKNKQLTAAFIALLSIIATSCKKSFLEVVPKGDNIAITYDDYNKLMNGSNFYVLGGAGAGSWQPAAIMGDEVSAESYAFNSPDGGFEIARSLFQWSDNVFPANNPPNDFNANNPQFLRNLLSNIYTLNKIANEVTNATEGTQQQKLELQAEAMAERAFTNFQLINYFTKPYNAATASTDLGFPVIKIADVTTKAFERGTVQQSYDFMINDLTQSIPNLALQPAIRTRISKAAAEGLLGKIYLFMGKNSEALTMFKNAFNDMAKMTTAPTLYNYNQTMAVGGSFLPSSDMYGPNSPFTNVTDITESLWAVMTYSGNENGSGYPADFLSIPTRTIALFDPSDWRLKFYSNLQTDLSTPIPGGRLRRYNLQWARIGVELPDLYLLKAEAEARTNDLAGAKADIETLRKNRMPLAVASVPVAATANQSSFIKFIIEERTREFTQEGARWFDMRRLANDPIYAGNPAPTHEVYQDGSNATIYTLKPARLTLRLPPLYLSQNPGMPDNP
ncbi:RagB/SusD family nutrient uptake outer membrane protein [Mucilaginibacter sp. SG564]|uniref:RagB/SusD family nutrient uptake outer membrane protein n=1 Tax=Mucilaginibacter sp. SG564 TaxID=2587022 RepID=UPI00155365DC|nr:RagB/SusD family nutrient uptake outer membrane protein [Mucilaginibacter sp. SG564]NOW95062.1 hypothetical protein [Mucilaginibacter sp. SG564]